MRAWIAIVTVVCAAVAVAALPPDAPDFAFGEVRGDRSPERRRASELRDEVLVAQEALLRRRWVDSLAALTRGAADRPEQVVVGAPLDALDGSRLATLMGRLVDDARAELVRHGVTRPAVDLGLFVIPNGDQAVARTVRVDGPRVEWYAGEADGRAYCITARLTPRVVPNSFSFGRWSPFEETNVLGPCAFYARHGMPGSGIQGWMQDAGAELAQRSLPIPEDGSIEDALMDVGYFGLRSGLEWADLRFESCVRGSSASCRALMLEPQPRRPADERLAITPAIVARGVPLLASVERGPAGLGQALEAGMLADLERQFGAEAFGRFWRSSETPTVAFEQAFGTSVDGWVRDWARSFEGASANINVAPSGGEIALMILYGVLGVALAVWVARARRVA